MTQPIDDTETVKGDIAYVYQALAALEWSHEIQGPQQLRGAQGPTWQACPVCVNIRPGDDYHQPKPKKDFADSRIGHTGFCMLANAIARLKKYAQ